MPDVPRFQLSNGHPLPLQRCDRGYQASRNIVTGQPDLFPEIHVPKNR